MCDGLVREKEMKKTKKKTRGITINNNNSIHDIYMYNMYVYIIIHVNQITYRKECQQ